MITVLRSNETVEFLCPPCLKSAEYMSKREARWFFVRDHQTRWVLLHEHRKGDDALKDGVETMKMGRGGPEEIARCMFSFFSNPLKSGTTLSNAREFVFCLE